MAAGGYWVRKSQFLLGVGWLLFNHRSWKGPYALVDGSIPTHTWAALVGVSELLKKNKRTLVLKGLCWEDQIRRKGIAFAVIKSTCICRTHVRKCQRTNKIIRSQPLA